MKHLSDEELGRHLDRRTSYVPLAGREREELVASIGQLAATAPQERRGFELFARRLLPAAAAMAAIVVVAVLALQLPRAVTPRVATSPGPPPSAPSAAASPNGEVAGISILTAKVLVGVVRDGTNEGAVVLADVRMDLEPVRLRRAPTCSLTELCTAAVIAEVDPTVDVVVAWQETEDGVRWLPLSELPTELGTFAFRVLTNAVEYLGPVVLKGAAITWPIADLGAGDHEGASLDLYAVGGWLVESPPFSCPAPQGYTGAEDLSYYCGGSWLSADRVYMVTSRSEDGFSGLGEIPGGLHVQGAAYREFAADPTFGDRGAEPRHGVYLVRSAGCPEIVMGGCPVWEMVGRLNPPAAADGPSTSPEARPTPTPSPSTPVITDLVPAEIDGEPVLRAIAAQDHIAAATDDTPFLIGGEVSYIQADCFVPDDFPTTPLLVPCNDNFVMRLGDGGVHLVISSDVQGFPSIGPAVLRVHVQDTRAADCPADYRERCERAVVVEEVLWTATPPPSDSEPHVDEMAIVTKDSVTVWTAPSAEGGEPQGTDLPAGTVAFLVDGREHSEGVDWWQIWTELSPEGGFAFGWVRESDSEGNTVLQPFEPACPPIDSPIAVRTIIELGWLRALACFGRQELTLRGDVSCSRPVLERSVGGASWLDSNRWCVMDGALGLLGPNVTGLLDQPPGNETVSGRYEVRGHFDDSESERCGPVRFGTPGPAGTPTPQTVMQCRQLFVVTSVAELP